MLGANPDFAAENFYKCRSISGKEISVLILSGQYIAIALVDKVKLSQCWLSNVRVSDCDGKNSYHMGHFVVICGYDVVTGEFEIRDSASPRKHERVPLECLDEACTSFGTDEDMLLVSLDWEDGNNLQLNASSANVQFL